MCIRDVRIHPIVFAHPRPEVCGPVVDGRAGISAKNRDSLANPYTIAKYGKFPSQKKKIHAVCMYGVPSAPVGRPYRFWCSVSKLFGGVFFEIGLFRGRRSDPWENPVPPSENQVDPFGRSASACVDARHRAKLKKAQNPRYLVYDHIHTLTPFFGPILKGHLKTRIFRAFP